MVSETELYMQRAEDEFLLAKNDMTLSNDVELKVKLGIPIDKTFYHSVISHAYFAIFHAAKAYLFSKGIKTSPPREHQKTYDSFAKLVNNGVLDKELLVIYADEMMKAEGLLHIFKREKKKRGRFTYNVKSEANIPFAQESVGHAREFISSIKGLLK